MNKQTLINSFNEEVGLEADLKAEIVDHLNTYPEELSQEDLNKIDTYLSEIQSDELELAHAYETLLHESEQYIKEVEGSHEDFVTGVAQTMKDELKHLDDMQDVASS